MSTRQADKVSGDLNAVDLADATMTDDEKCLNLCAVPSGQPP